MDKEGITYEKIPQMTCPVCTTKLDIIDGDPIPVIAPKPDYYNQLTKREKQVLVLVAQGKTNREIAQLLFISKRTVEIHRANMMRKLALRPMSDQLVNYAREHNLTKPI